jgi:rare lipoprotein A (peptidoglycan hydrolase)
MTPPTLDVSQRSGSALGPGELLIEPGTTTAVRVEARPAAAQPGAPLVAVVIPPKPRPAPRPAPAPAPVTVQTGSSGGSWRYDAEVSWYGPDFYGHRTACGQTLTTSLLGVAHKTLPCGTMITFKNPKNGRTITVPVIDRGPYVAGRSWDLTGATCAALDHCWTGPIYWRYA